MFRHKLGNRGFSLMEVLIVVAIVGVLVSIGIPVLGGQVDRAKNATDLANMRNAYAAALAEWQISSDQGASTVYYYNGSGVETTSSGIEGYGQSSEPVQDFAGDFLVPVSGTPNVNGKANFLAVYMNGTGIDHMTWGVSGYAGRTVSSKAQHEALVASGDAHALDLLLLQSIDDYVHGLTYGEIRQLLDEGKIKKYNDANGNTAFQVALSDVDEASREIVRSKNGILVPKLLEGAGYDTSVPEDSQYILNSRDKYKNGDIIWVSLGAKLNNAPADEKASKAFSYVKSNGESTDEDFQFATRSKLY